MALIETESIILRSYNLAEADKIIVFLSEDHGMIRGVAKGVKRLKSKFGSGLEPFSIVRLTYKQKDNIELVGIEKAELVRSLFGSASDPDFLDRFSYLGDLLITFSPPHDPNETLYRMVRACLDAAAEAPSGLLSIGVYFELWLLRLAGYLPDWKKCAQCKREFAADAIAKVGSNFYLYCINCRQASDNVSVDGELRDLFAAALRLSPAEFVSFSAADQRRLDELSSILKRIISQSAGKDLFVGKLPMPSDSGLN